MAVFKLNYSDKLKFFDDTLIYWSPLFSIISVIPYQLWFLDLCFPSKGVKTSGVLCFFRSFWLVRHHVYTLTRLPVCSGSLVQGGGADGTGKLSSTHIVSCRAGGIIVGHHRGAYWLQCPVGGVLVPVHARCKGREDVCKGKQGGALDLSHYSDHPSAIMQKASWEHFHASYPAEKLKSHYFLPLGKRIYKHF